MSLAMFDFWAMELGTFRVLFARLRNDLTAKIGITYIEAGQYITHDDVSAAEAMDFCARLRQQGYVRTEVQP